MNLQVHEEVHSKKTDQSFSLSGFSSDELSTLQEAGDDSVLPPSPLSPLSLYPTPLEQFTHHWDVVEVRTHLPHNT